jgi:transcriptional regulator GlxA family with amidase domain
VGVSRRQIERLFKRHLDSMPAKYYLALRLEKARTQLQRTSKSIIQISLACGFFVGGPLFECLSRAVRHGTP